MSGQAEFWNQRYSGEGFSFGTEPNAFLASQAHRLKPGMRALVPGDGEGRNGVWLAQQGLAVDTVDVSPVGAAKAQALAKARGVEIGAQIADLLDWDWPRERYDIVAALYIHFFDGDRPRMHRAMLDALKPGGLIVLEVLPHRAARIPEEPQLGRPARGQHVVLQGQARSRFRRLQVPAARRSRRGT